MTKTVLFYRNFQKFSGGHLKVSDYYNHVKAFPEYDAKVYFSDNSVWDKTNPWLFERSEILKDWHWDQANILFLAGMDWLALDEEERNSQRVPIINLIQHVRHGSPNDERYGFLFHRAIRICVSDEIGTILRNTGVVNGPLFVIPNGIDFKVLPQPLPDGQRSTDILIVGVKRKRLALKFSARLQWKLRDGWRPFSGKIKVITAKIPRDQFLAELNNAKLSIFLPNSTEGFYLPALEGMALRTLVICPDCVGNRGFCTDGVNCFRPSYRERYLIEAVEAALKSDFEQRNAMLDAGQQTATSHSLTVERGAFLDILRNIDAIW